MDYCSDFNQVLVEGDKFRGQGASSSRSLLFKDCLDICNMINMGFLDLILLGLIGEGLMLSFSKGLIGSLPIRVGAPPILMPGCPILLDATRTIVPSSLSLFRAMGDTFQGPSCSKVFGYWILPFLR